MANCSRGVCFVHRRGILDTAWWRDGSRDLVIDRFGLQRAFFEPRWGDPGAPIRGIRFQDPVIGGALMSAEEARIDFLTDSGDVLNVIFTSGAASPSCP